ncbi:MAG: hypothetical protein M1167_06175 [Chloroflexi bacterium]|nr:hypothetical protein [Chloroflexota bacterium]
MAESQPETKSTHTFPYPRLYKGGIEKNSQQSRTAKDLIDAEWKIIDKLQKLADDPEHKHQQAFYYQTLASHVRTLSVLLKLHGKQDDSQDLAKLLSEIDTNALKLAKRLKQRCKR